MEKGEEIKWNVGDRAGRIVEAERASQECSSKSCNILRGKLSFS